MAPEAYGTLAEVYEWLVPDDLLEPEGAVAAFAGVVDDLAAGGRVLDCAAGTGELAVGLALRGFQAVATDASRAMIERTSALARRHAVELRAAVCRWEELGRQEWGASFDAVFCVGNSLPHAAGRAARRDALAAMRGVLRDQGVLVVTSRNWERLRELRPGLEVAGRLVRRRGVDGVVAYAWTIAEAWEDPHAMDIAVALLGGDRLQVHRERMSFWPFSRDMLEDDLRAAGLSPVASTWAPEAERYLVIARRDDHPPER